MYGIVGYIGRKENHPILVDDQVISKIANFTFKLPGTLEYLTPLLFEEEW